MISLTTAAVQWAILIADLLYRPVDWGGLAQLALLILVLFLSIGVFYVVRGGRLWN